VNFIQNALKVFVVGAAVVAVTTVSIPRPAQADTATTAAIIAGAAAIVGVLLYDANQQPYYVSNNRRYYVSQPEATYYRSHYHAVQRQAWVPEQSYPVARPYPGNNGNHHGNNSNNNGNHNGNNGNH
jgi:hypothetical protein